MAMSITPLAAPLRGSLLPKNGCTSSRNRRRALRATIAVERKAADVSIVNPGATAEEAVDNAIARYNRKHRKPS